MIIIIFERTVPVYLSAQENSSQRNQPNVNQRRWQIKTKKNHWMRNKNIPIDENVKYTWLFLHCVEINIDKYRDKSCEQYVPNKK